MSYRRRPSVRCWLILRHNWFACAHVTFNAEHMPRFRHQSIRGDNLADGRVARATVVLIQSTVVFPLTGEAAITKKGAAEFPNISRGLLGYVRHKYPVWFLVRNTCVFIHIAGRW
jgi:hypothetical protein